MTEGVQKRAGSLLRQLIREGSHLMPPLLEGYVEVEAMTCVLRALGVVISNTTFSKFLAGLVFPVAVDSRTTDAFKPRLAYIHAFDVLEAHLARNYAVATEQLPGEIDFTAVLANAPLSLSIVKITDRASEAKQKVDDELQAAQQDLEAHERRIAELQTEASRASEAQQAEKSNAERLFREKEELSRQFETAKKRVLDLEQELKAQNAAEASNQAEPAVTAVQDAEKAAKAEPAAPTAADKGKGPMVDPPIGSHESKEEPAPATTNPDKYKRLRQRYRETRNELAEVQAKLMKAEAQLQLYERWGSQLTLSAGVGGTLGSTPTQQQLPPGPEQEEQKGSTDSGESSGGGDPGQGPSGTKRPPTPRQKSLARAREAKATKAAATTPKKKQKRN